MNVIKKWLKLSWISYFIMYFYNSFLVKISMKHVQEAWPLPTFISSVEEVEVVEHFLSFLSIIFCILEYKILAQKCWLKVWENIFVWDWVRLQNTAAQTIITGIISTINSFYVIPSCSGLLRSYFTFSTYLHYCSQFFFGLWLKTW